MRSFFNLKVWWEEIDKINFILISILLIIGIILSFSLNESFFIFNKHLMFSLIAFVGMIFLSSLDSKTLRRVSLFFFIICILVLFLILFLEYEIKGSKRWLKFHGLSIQPSEFIKPFYFVLSAWLITQGIGGRRRYLFTLLFSFIVISSLIILQPDFGMTILFFLTFFCQLFIAGLSIYLVILALFSLFILSFTSYYLFDHVQKRVELFINPLSDTYQIDLSLKAFKSGGLLGKGPGQGILKEKIPDANTDFIFAVAGEELGFIFCSIIILLILFIIIRILLKLLKMKDPFIIISIVGLVCCFGLQSLINIFSSLSIIPTKGMTLPFISYGGSSMLSSSILFGFLLSLTKTKNTNE
jgi:cell division protein FtsW